MASKAARVKEYINSGLILHDYLVTYVDGFMRRMRRALNNGTRANPVLIFWPKKAVRADDGTMIKRMVAMDLDEVEVLNVKKHLEEMVKRTDAYAALFVDTRGGEVRAVLESPHGSATWTMRRERHGDLTVLTEPVQADNVDWLGVIGTQG